MLCQERLTTADWLRAARYHHACLRIQREGFHEYEPRVDSTEIAEEAFRCVVDNEEPSYKNELNRQLAQSRIQEVREEPLLFWEGTNTNTVAIRSSGVSCHGCLPAIGHVAQAGGLLHYKAYIV